MPDIGWQELFLIALVTIIVVGPKEIPRVLRTVSLWARKIRGLAREFQNGMDDLAREADLEDLKKDIQAAEDFDIERNIEDMVDPTGEYAKSIQDIEDSVETNLEDTPVETSPPKIDAADDAATDIPPKPASGQV